MLQDDEFIWHAQNSRFTYEAAVDIAAISPHEPRLLFCSDELSVTVASQAQRDAAMLQIGDMITLLDAGGRAAKMAASCRRKVPESAVIACCFGCQPGRAEHYVAAYDPANIGARFLIMHAQAKAVLKTTYGQLHAERDDMKSLFSDKLKIHIETFFGDVAFDDRNCVIGTAAPAKVPRMTIDEVSSKLLWVAWHGASIAADTMGDDADPLVMWLRKGDQVLRELIMVVALDVYSALAAINSKFKMPTETHWTMVYLAIAQWHILAIHRRAALDASMKAKPGRSSGAVAAKQGPQIPQPESKPCDGVVPGPADAFEFPVAAGEVQQLEPCRVLLALLVMHAAEDTEKKLEMRQFKK